MPCCNSSEPFLPKGRTTEPSLPSDPLRRLITELESDLSLREPNQFRERVEALDRLDAYFPSLAQTAPGAESLDPALHRREKAIRDRLEAVNAQLYEAVRSEIQRGAQPEALLRWIQPPIDTGEPQTRAKGMGYDFLDELVSGVLQIEEPGAEQLPSDPEQVFYQPTPARHIFDLIRLTGLTAEDVLVDLGSGLGHVPLLVSICTEARSIGIELEPAYVARAQQCAHGLNLEKATFVQQDARTADLSVGTVFFLYTPFTGSILRSVLDRLRREAAARRIRICSYGPCTAVIARESWLTPDGAPRPDRIALFRSEQFGCSPGL